MNWNWVWVGALTTVVLGSGNFGMAQERSVIRAQGGVVYPESYPVYHEGEYDDDWDDDDWDDDDFEPFDKVHDCWTYITTLGGKQCEYPPGRFSRNGGPYSPNGFAGYNGRDRRRLNFQYRYRYRAPENLRYPPANQPAGVVVYPYYTVKGPDDFFLNETLGN